MRRAHVQLLEELGKGQFGSVSKAFLDESSIKHGIPKYMVAVKSVHDPGGEGAEELLQEAAVMSQVPQHGNIETLIGVVTRGSPLLMIITYAEHGSLLDALRKKADGCRGVLVDSDRPKTALQVAADVASGMAHLARYRLVHRDLAARNVLLDASLACVIADFGLSRSAQATDTNDSAYYRGSTGIFPLRYKP